jgi:hypothetical protein
LENFIKRRDKQEKMLNASAEKIDTMLKKQRVKNDKVSGIMKESKE